MLSRYVFLIGILVCSAAPDLFAGGVKLLADSSEVYVGVPFKLAIDVTASKSHQAPDFPELEGATSKLVKTSTTSQTSIVFNGRRMGGSKETTRYLYQITPLRVGILKIPRIELKVDGERVYTRASNFRVSKSEKGDLLFVDLLGVGDRVYVGESIDVTLRVWLKKFQHGRKTLSYREMWQAIDKNSTNWGLFAELVNRRNPDVKIRQSQRKGRDGATHPYDVFELTKKIWPTRAGKLSAGGVRIVVDYPIKVSRDVFGGVQFTQSKPIFATVGHTNIEVLAIPTEGRPPGYTGAVGGHSIEITATPDHVRVGDPITLNIIVKGSSQLEHLQAPRLSEVPGFSEHFQIGDDTLPGVVKNKRKTFSLSVRALSDDVEEIPRIPLTYFDTDSEEFKTTYSEPIPLDVAPARKMSNMQIVQSGDPTQQTDETMTRLGAGIEANRSDIDSLLADQRVVFSPSMATIVVGSPLVFAACLLVRRRSDRRRANTGLVAQRTAHKKALALLSRLSEPDGGAQVQGTVLTVALGYVGDRLGIKSEGLTRKDAAEALTKAGVSHDVVEDWDRVIAECEAAEFGGNSGGVDASHVANVHGCVERIERQLAKRKTIGLASVA